MFGPTGGTQLAALYLACANYRGAGGSNLLDSYAVFDGQHGRLHPIGLITAHIQPRGTTQVPPTLLSNLKFSHGAITVLESYYRITDPFARPSGQTVSTWTYTAGTLQRIATTTRPSGHQLTVTGADGNSYDLDVGAQDRITDCAAHSYGRPMIAFLHAHPCLNAHRLLATLTLDGRKAMLSIITITFSPSAGDDHGYDAAQMFQDTEQASGTGSMNDLLREGRRVPGVSGSIPSTGAFTIAGQDASAAVFDAWWAAGATADQDPRLVTVENALFPSQATPLD